MAILRELVLTCPFKFEREREFNRGTRCVCAPFEHELGRMRTNELRKLIVEVDPVGGAPAERMLAVCCVHLKYDFDLHWKLRGGDRKQLMLKALYEGSLLVPDSYGVDKQRLTDTYEKLRNTPLKHVRKWGKRFKSPDGTRYAQVKYDYHLDYVRIFVEIKEIGKGGSVTEIELARTPPHEWKFVPLLGRFQWLSDDSVSLEPSGEGLPTLTMKV
jgi:hypothetical protein